MKRFARRGMVALAVGLTALTTPGPLKAAGEPEKREREVRIVRRAAGGYLGVRLQDLSTDDVSRLKLATERGALVDEVVEGSPAARAGLEAADVILRYDGESVRSAAQLARLVAETPAGRRVSLEVSRAGASRTLTVELAEPRRAWNGGPHLAFDLELPELPEVPEPPELAGPWAGKLLDRDWMGEGLRGALGGPRKLGLRYQEISGQLAQYFGLTNDRGVLVTHVEQDGPAAKAGLKAGDVILEFAGKALEDAADFRQAVRQAEAGAEVPVKLRREGKTLELMVALAGRERGEGEKI